MSALSQQYDSTFPIESQIVSEMRFVNIPFCDLWMMGSAVTDNDGRPYGNALMVLSYVMKMYQPVDVISNGVVVDTRQWFRGREMRFRYAVASRQLGGISRFQMRRAIARLVELGVVGVRYESTEEGANAAVYVWPIPQGILSLSNGVQKNGSSEGVQSTKHRVCSQLDTGCAVNCTQNNNNKNDMSTDVVDVLDETVPTVKEKKKRRRPEKPTREEQPRRGESKYDRAMGLIASGSSHEMENVDEAGYERVYAALRSRWMQLRYKSNDVPEDVRSGATPFDVVPYEGAQREILRPWIDELVGMCDGDVDVACDVVCECVRPKPGRLISYALGRYFGERGDVDELRQMVRSAKRSASMRRSRDEMLAEAARGSDTWLPRC